MTITVVKGKTEVRFLISKERAEKTVAVGGNTSTTTQAMTPIEANRELNELLRKGYKNKAAGKK